MVSQATRVGSLQDITRVAGGTGHSLALSGDGKLWSWVSNMCGELGRKCPVLGSPNPGLLEAVLKSRSPQARAAGVRADQRTHAAADRRALFARDPGPSGLTVCRLRNSPRKRTNAPFLFCGKVLGFLSAGDSIEDVLTGYPQLTREDILACLAYARRLSELHSTVRLAS